MPTIVPITDPEDPRIEPYRDVRERDLVGRDGLFIAEGAVVVRSLVQSNRYRARSLLIAEKRLEALEPMLAVLPADTPVYTDTQPVLDRIAGFPLHRGILAVGEKTGVPSVADLLGACGPVARVVMLFGIGNHDNMGGIFRNAAAFGATAMILDSDCCDPLYRKAIRVSVGAALTVPTLRLARGDDPLALVAAHDYAALALSPAGSRELADVVRPDRVAVLFGTEGPGLPQAILDRVATVRIAMAGGLDSLNVATSSGIVLHHFANGSPAARP